MFMAEPTRPELDVSDKASRKGLLFGAFAIFFLAFVVSGNDNAVPQLFFQRFYPHEKNLLLAISLLLATMAAALAVALSKRFRLSTTQMLAAMVTAVIVTLILYSTRQIALFIGAIVLVQFAVFYLTNLLDY